MISSSSWLIALSALVTYVRLGQRLTTFVVQIIYSHCTIPSFTTSSCVSPLHQCEDWVVIRSSSVLFNQLCRRSCLGVAFERGTTSKNLTKTTSRAPIHRKLPVKPSRCNLIQLLELSQRKSQRIWETLLNPVSNWHVDRNYKIVIANLSQDVPRSEPQMDASDVDSETGKLVTIQDSINQSDPSL